MQVQADCSVPAFAENLDEKRIVVGRLALLVLNAVYFLSPWKRIVNLVSPSLEDTNTPSSSSRRETTPPSCSLCLKPMIRRQNRVNKGNFWGCQQWPKCNGTRRPWERGQRRHLSSMTKVLSLMLAAAQHLDSSRTDCWNRAVRFGRPDLLEVCANSDSPLVEAVESAGGEGLRTSFLERVRSGHQSRSRTSPSVLFNEKAKTRVVLFTLSSLWSIITTRVSFFGWNRSRGSESASTWLSRSFCTNTHPAYPVGDRIH